MVSVFFNKDLHLLGSMSDLSNKLYFLNKGLASSLCTPAMLMDTPSIFAYQFPCSWACSSANTRTASCPDRCRAKLTFLFTFLCYANQRWILRCQPVDKSPLQCISTNAHLQGKQFLCFPTELRLRRQFEARVPRAGRTLIPQAASAWAGSALVYADVNLKWLSWSHYCYCGFTLGRKPEQSLSQDCSISRSICPLCTGSQWSAPAMAQ